MQTYPVGNLVIKFNWQKRQSCVAVSQFPRNQIWWVLIFSNKWAEIFYLSNVQTWLLMIFLMSQLKTEM